MKNATLFLTCLASLTLSPFALSAQSPFEQKFVDIDLPPLSPMGSSLSLDGNTLAIGSRGPTTQEPPVGSVSVFRQQLTGWYRQVRLTAGTGTFASGYGASVSLQGPLLAVGAPADSSSPGGQIGAVYVYRDLGGLWTHEATLHAATPAGAEAFGASVAVDGDVIAVGVPARSFGLDFNAGAVSIFRFDGQSWNEEAELSLPDSAQARFGSAVDLSGDTLAVGAPDDDPGALQRAGTVSAFRHDGVNWNHEGTLSANLGAPSDQLGMSVSVDGDALVAGALAQSAPDRPGYAVVFRRQGTSWIQEQRLENPQTPEDQSDLFGECVSLEGERLIVGASSTPLATPSSRGRCFLYERTESHWARQAEFTTPEGLPLGSFGSPCALDEGRIAVRGLNLTSPGGAVYLYGLPLLPGAQYPERCRGSGNAASMCLECPCSNEAPAGTNGGCLNSSARSARLRAWGSSSVTLTAGQSIDLRFGLQDGSPETLCVLLSSSQLAPTQSSNPCVGLGTGVLSSSLDGLRCVAVNLRRHGGRASDANGYVGDSNSPWGGEGAPEAGIAASSAGFVSGQVRHFQSFYRDDPLLGCGRGINTTQAIAVTFQP